MHLKIVRAVIRPFLSLAVCQRPRNLFILSPSFPDLPYDVRVTLKTHPGVRDYIATVGRHDPTFSWQTNDTEENLI